MLCMTSMEYLCSPTFRLSESKRLANRKTNFKCSNRIATIVHSVSLKKTIEIRLQYFLQGRKSFCATVELVTEDVIQIRVSKDLTYRQSHC